MSRHAVSELDAVATDRAAILPLPFLAFFDGLTALPSLLAHS